MYVCVDNNCFFVPDVKDFVPHVVDAGGIFHPAHYAPLFTLVTNARTWLSANRVSKKRRLYDGRSGMISWIYLHLFGQ